MSGTGTSTSTSPAAGTGTTTVAGGTTGTVDLSTPAQRLAFCNAVTGGPGGTVLPALANLVSVSLYVLPAEVAMLLDLPPGSTYQMGVTQLQNWWAAGRGWG